MANILINSLKNDIITKQKHFVIPLEGPKTIQRYEPLNDYEEGKSKQKSLKRRKIVAKYKSTNIH